MSDTRATPMTAATNSQHPAPAPGTPGSQPLAPVTRSAAHRVLAALRDPSTWAEWAAPVGLVILVIVFGALNPIFWSKNNISAVLVASAILIVLTLGQTFVVATGGIDLSNAATMTFGAVSFGYAFAHGWPLWLCCIVAIFAGAIVGVVNGLFIGRGKITDFIVTLGTLSAATGAALVLSDGKPTTIISSALLRLSTQGIWVFGWTFLIGVVLAGGAYVLMFRTRFGTHLLAAGGSADAATASGISTARIKVAVYVIAGALSGIAAILLVARVGASEPAANTTFLLNSVAAVVLGGVSLVGGRATISGPFIGALLLTALTNGLTLLGVSQYYQPIAVGAVVVLAALLTRFRK